MKKGKAKANTSFFSSNMNDFNSDSSKSSNSSNNNSNANSSFSSKNLKSSFNFATFTSYLRKDKKLTLVKQK